MAIQKESYETFEAGTYQVNDLQFFTTDNSGNPIYVSQETKSGPVMVARYRTSKDGDDGPPGSIRPDELPLLVYAFGGDPTKLPEDKLNALVVAQDEINNAAKSVRVRVGDKGWINQVYGANVPVGDYVFSYLGVRSKDENGNPRWFSGKWGEQTVVLLQVAMPESPFNACVVDLWLNREVFGLLRALVPDVANSILGDAENELSRLDEMAKENQLKIFGAIVENDNGNARLDKSTLRPISADDAVDVVGSQAVEYITHLYQAIADGVDQKPFAQSAAFTTPGKLADAGKTWAKQPGSLGDICKTNNIPKAFAEMTKAQVKLILEKLGRDDLAKLIDPPQDEEPW